MNSYTKIDGKYYKDNPEVQRVRNRLRPIYYKLAGGFTNYYALPKNERQKLIDRAREKLILYLYENNNFFLSIFRTLILSLNVLKKKIIQKINLLIEKN